MELILIKDIKTAAPNSSKTIETVVEVGIPIVLKISVNITAVKINIISSK